MIYTAAVPTVDHEGAPCAPEGFAKARSWAENPPWSLQNGNKKANSAVGGGSGSLL